MEFLLIATAGSACQSKDDLGGPGWGKISLYQGVQPLKNHEWGFLFVEWRLFLSRKIPVPTQGRKAIEEMQDPFRKGPVENLFLGLTPKATKQKFS